MKETAWLFSRPETMSPGKGKELYRRYTAARSIYDQTDDVLGRSITQASFGRSREELFRNHNIHPAHFAYQMAYLGVARRTLEDFETQPTYIAGNGSQISAFCAAGAYDYATGLEIIRALVEATNRVCVAIPGRMMAVKAPNQAHPESLMRAFRLFLAAENSDTEVILSGQTERIAMALESLQREGIIAYELPMPGAFQSPIMESSAESFLTALEGIPIRHCEVPVIGNSTAELIMHPDDVREELANGFTHMIRWREIMDLLNRRDEIMHYLEIGEEATLVGFNAREFGIRAALVAGGIGGVILAYKLVRRHHDKDNPH